MRLPVQFEFDTDRVYIRKAENGDVIISKNRFYRDDWSQFFGVLNRTAVPKDLLNYSDRNQGVADRDPLEGID